MISARPRRRVARTAAADGGPIALSAADPLNIEMWEAHTVAYPTRGGMSLTTGWSTPRADALVASLAASPKGAQVTMQAGSRTPRLSSEASSVQPMLPSV